MLRRPNGKRYSQILKNIRIAWWWEGAGFLAAPGRGWVNPTGGIGRGRIETVGLRQVRLRRVGLRRRACRGRACPRSAVRLSCDAAVITHPPEPTEPAVESPQESADPDWFREPTPREHRMAAALFVAFGAFFALLFLVLSGWWFRWVILGLGVISVLHGLWHGAASWRAAVQVQNPQSKIQNQ